MFSRSAMVAALSVAMSTAVVVGVVVMPATSLGATMPAVHGVVDDAAHLAHSALRQAAAHATRGSDAAVLATAATLPDTRTAQKASSDPTWPEDDGDGCPAPTWPLDRSTGSPANGRRVLVIGDSRTRDSREDLVDGLVGSGWTPTVRCWGGKRLDWGIEQVRRAAELDELPDYVVVALGINDIGWTPLEVAEQRADTMLDLLGPQRHVLWVEEYSTRSPSAVPGAHLDYVPRVAEFNGWLRDRADQHPGLSVIPWARAVVEHGLSLGDGIHYTSNGYRVRAAAVVDGLNARLESDLAAGA